MDWISVKEIRSISSHSWANYRWGRGYHKQSNCVIPSIPRQKSERSKFLVMDFTWTKGRHGVKHSRQHRIRIVQQCLPGNNNNEHCPLKFLISQRYLVVWNLVPPTLRSMMSFMEAVSTSLTASALAIINVFAWWSSGISWHQSEKENHLK